MKKIKIFLNIKYIKWALNAKGGSVRFSVQLITNKFSGNVRHLLRGGLLKFIMKRLVMGF